MTSPDLKRLQGWMQAVVTHRGGVGAGIASPEARHQLDIASGAAAQVVTPSATLTAEERLAIYQRSYFGRLLEVLRATFPALHHALGDRLFEAFALDYLDTHPPQSTTLDHLADRLPEHLANTRPDGGPESAGHEPWIDFVVELATVERDFLAVWDGPGVEGQAAPDGRAIAALAPPACGALRPRPTPCLRLYALRYPVHDYLSAVRQGSAPDLPAPKPTQVALTRRDYRLHFVLLTPPQRNFLQALDGQQTVSQALEGVAADIDCRPQNLLRPAQDWLVAWAGQALYHLVPIPPPVPQSN